MPQPCRPGRSRCTPTPSRRCGPAATLAHRRRHRAARAGAGRAGGPGSDVVPPRGSRCRRTRSSARSRRPARGAASPRRLPQIVLRRRTLPWERSTDLERRDRADPWLALVLVAEGEGQLLTRRGRQRQCVTPGVDALRRRRRAEVVLPRGAPRRSSTGPSRPGRTCTLLCHVPRGRPRRHRAGDGRRRRLDGGRARQPAAAAGVRYLACLVNLRRPAGPAADRSRTTDLGQVRPRPGRCSTCARRRAAAYGDLVEPTTRPRCGCPGRAAGPVGQAAPRRCGRCRSTPGRRPSWPGDRPAQPGSARTGPAARRSRRPARPTRGWRPARREGAGRRRSIDLGVA